MWKEGEVEVRSSETTEMNSVREPLIGRRVISLGGERELRREKILKGTYWPAVKEE